MLINAQHGDQVRLAIIDGTTLETYQVDMAEAGLMRGNIYRGTVANVQPNLNAAFIDIGGEKHGFLSVDDVLPSVYHKKFDGKGRPRIDQVLERGKPILVQVTKDGVGNKGPALTTNLSLAGRYLVLMPLEEVRGISRKVDDDKGRKTLRERLAKLSLPSGMGVIVRTNGLDQNLTTLNRDLSALLRLWRRIHAESEKGKGPRLLYSDQNLILHALRDHLDSTIDQVVVDDEEAYKQAERYLRTFMPRSKLRLLHYRERMPLFSRYQLEPQIERIFSRVVPLPSGGSIVIDPTEALTAIDVNSGRTAQASDHEETILKANLEAAHEVARQLRLRDIGGLVVVDFIDMRLRKNQRKVEKALRDAMKTDRARHTIDRISRNGLVEINRQRLKQALRHRTHRACPTCSGVGSIPSLEFAAVSLLGRIEARAAIGSLEGVVIALHPEVADALQNNHRQELVALEQEFGLRIEIIASPSLHRTEERVEWRQLESGKNRRQRETQVAALSATDLAPVKRRRRGKAAAAEALPEPEPATPAEAPAGDEEAPSRSRRRRGGRRRSSRSSEQPSP
ncbi:MAG: Rne/Rng family ribonuclease, partial [Acidobacteria bacterium]